MPITTKMKSAKESIGSRQHLNYNKIMSAKEVFGKIYSLSIVFVLLIALASPNYVFAKKDVLVAGNIQIEEI